MCETMHFLLFSTHTNVALINLHILILPCWFWIFPLIFAQINIHTIKWMINVLCCGIYPRGNSIDYFPVWKLNLTLYFRMFRNIFVDYTFPMTILILNYLLSYFLAWVFFSVPIIKVSKNTDSFSCWCPFLILEMIFFSVNTIFLVTFSDFIKTPLSIKLPDLSLCHVSKFFEEMLC